METMQWNDILATGIPTIDKQHKRIVKLANQLGEAIESGDTKIAEQVLKDLVDYTVYHFSFEEELMEKAGYAALPLHRRVHQLFTARIPQFQQRYRAGEDVLRELHDMLAHWLFHHIQNEDRDYADDIKAYLALHQHSRFSTTPPTRFAEDAPSTLAPDTRLPPPTKQAQAAAPKPGASKPGFVKRIVTFFTEEW